VATRWRALETRCAASFFQSWSWVGCLAAERFTDPVLLAVREAGEDVALALLNRRATLLAPTTLWLAESGNPALDAMYVEHNGILHTQGHAKQLTSCLAALLGAGRTTRLVLSGVDDAHLEAARGTGALLRLEKTQNAPFIDLAGLNEDPSGFLDMLSSGTRYQLRRAERRYGTRGTLAIRRAGTVAEAYAVLAELAVHHQITWTARDRAGAFANPAFTRFHHALIAESLPRGEIDLLRITAGDALIGCLYNFRHRGQALAYQSGFNYADAGPHEKPGLVCHHMAIEAARADHLTRYDFLAGEDRYKSSLANDATALHWFELMPRWSPRALALRLFR
jgi:CelD/BcsL family acetyltransferase involved in cellulose biosynthesis